MTFELPPHAHLLVAGTASDLVCVFLNHAGEKRQPVRRQVLTS
jgi:hypothetical protein